MRKIRLKLNALAVESFQTAAATAGTGTVEGHQVSVRLGCVSQACPTEYVSCEADVTYPLSCEIECYCTSRDMIC